jgi:hypothetical protein
MFPTAGPRSQKAMWGALSALLICGDVGPTLVAWALQNFRCVGIAAHSLDGLYGVLPPSAHRLLNRQDAEANRFVHGENIIWAVKLPAYGETEPNSGYARQWAIIEDLALDMVSAIAEWPSGRLDSAKRTWGSRLPSLPTSPDVAVAMVTAVINRQRGRAGFDDGAQQPDYGRYAEPDLWLCAPRTEDLGGQPEAIIQLTLHGVAEYWAAGIFASLPSRVAAGPTTEIDEIREHAVRLIRSWEVRDGAVSNTMHGDFARRSRGVPARQLMTVLTEAFLSIFEANLADPRGYLTSYARCINPLVLVVAEGSGGVDDTMTLSAAYWAAFAAAYSAAKPAALVPTLLLDGASLKLVSLHRDLRLAIHGYVPHSIKDQTRIHATRTAIGVTLAHRLIASTTVLHAAGADRIIAIASVLLDFIPVGDTILGLEVPVSRIPFSSPKTAFLHLNFLAMSSAAAGALQGSACILAPVVAKDTAEHWALDMQERLSLLLPSLGLQPPPRGDAGDLLFAMLERSGIVFFVGHAMAADAWGGLNLGDQWLGADALGRVEWTGKIAILIGCETAALDAAKGDIGRTLVELGARAVVGATAKISTDAAELFLVQFMRAAMAGEAIDYAFFIARRLVVLAEAIAAQGEAWPDASRKAIDLLDRDPQAPFGEILASAGLTWEKAYRAAVYGLSFTLLGGATERIR